MDLAAVFAKGDIAHMMELVFNRPVATPEQLDLSSETILPRQTGDGKADMGGGFASLEFSALTSAAQDLGNARPF